MCMVNICCINILYLAHASLIWVGLFIMYKSCLGGVVYYLFAYIFLFYTQDIMFIFCDSLSIVHSDVFYTFGIVLWSY
jgi:hypothetical protein